MEKTNVFATKEELELLKRAARKGWLPGDMMIVTSLGEGINRDLATVDARKLCHQIALKHGLPEIEGYYGINKEGEFVTV